MAWSQRAALALVAAGCILAPLLMANFGFLPGGILAASIAAAGVASFPARA